MPVSFKPIRILILEEQLDELITCCYREVTEIREYTIIDGHDDEGHGHFVVHDRDDDLYLIIDPMTHVELMSRCLCRDYSLEDCWEFICTLFREGHEALDEVSKHFEPTEDEKKILEFMVDPCKEEE